MSDDRLDAGVLRLAVYGTLMEGQRNFGFYLGAARRSVTRSTIRGDLYPVVVNGDYKGFPAADLLGRGEIVVDVVEVNVDERVLAAIAMETDAGYVPMLVHTSDGEGALAFHLDVESPWGKKLVGPRIANGDWVEWDRRHQIEQHLNAEGVL